MVRDALVQSGPAEIYAQHIEPPMHHHVHELSELGRRPNAPRPLVFHASSGSWPVFQALQQHGREIVLLYHDFSPPEYDLGFTPQVACGPVRGRWELEQIRDRVVLAVADSEFGAQELRDLGYPMVHVVAPTPDVDRLNRVVPDPAMLARISTWGLGPLVLCVAEQLPHARIERVFAAVAVLQQEHLVDARLAFVGVDRFPLYSQSLRVMARTLGLCEPHLLGRITDAELSALHLRARAFLTLSEHEGFCAPVVDAMATGLPVVASAHAAITATVGRAGILIEEPDDPALAAALVHRVLTDEDLRHTLIGRGVSRAKELAAPVSLPQLLALIRSSVSHHRAVTP